MEECESQDSSAPSPFDALPDETVAHIMSSFSDTSDLARMRLACRRFHAVGNDDHVWARLFCALCHVPPHVGLEHARPTAWIGEPWITSARRIKHRVYVETETLGECDGLAFTFNGTRLDEPIAVHRLCPDDLVRRLARDITTGLYIGAIDSRPGDRHPGRSWLARHCEDLTRASPWSWWHRIYDGRLWPGILAQHALIDKPPTVITLYDYDD